MNNIDFKRKLEDLIAVEWGNDQKITDLEVGPGIWISFDNFREMKDRFVFLIGTQEVSWIEKKTVLNLDNVEVE